MFIIRPIGPDDASALRTFAQAASPGIANLPHHPPRLNKMLQKGLASFNSKVTTPADEIYPFILEESLTGERLGTCSITATAGAQIPFCTFHIEMENGVPKGLQLRSYSEGPSELCALYLLPNHRHGGLGKLLSLSRLLFIAAHPERFKSTVRADMRGDIAPDGTSAFWNAIGARYCHCTLKEILAKLDREEIQLCQLLPSTLIPWQQLGPLAQAIVGTTHSHTQPALHLLTSEGLTFQQEVSVLDGGPIIAGATRVLASVRESFCTPLADVVTTLNATALPALLSNEKTAYFRACRSHVCLDTGGHASLDLATATALELEVGDPLRYRLLL